MGRRKHTYADALRSELHFAGLSVNKLGALVYPKNPATGRRRVFRHLAGMSPSAKSRAAYARVLKAPHLKTPTIDDPVSQSKRSR